jgi:eukaryotic-like serine/threonine-protein kinase
MEINDAMTFGLLAVKVGLIKQQQFKEALEDVRMEMGVQEVDLIHLRSYLERKKLLTDFQSSKLMKGDMDGYFLGGYRIHYKISSGSFGRVYRADDPRTERDAAVKVLRRRWSEDQQKIDLFIREGKVGLTLKHPNIVEVMAINQDQATKSYYIAMEFVEGGNLREVMHARSRSTGRLGLGVEESLKLIDDCAQGLAHAYSKGLTHRDIKLTNILISSRKEAKLVDFGLAQMFAAIGREEEQVDRTVDYAGLEKATGVKQGDVRSDIFFLGSVLFEMLTGRPPLDMTRDRYARMNRRRFEDVQRLRPGEIDAPGSVYGLVESMLAFDPRRRYQTPAQLLDAIRKARRDIASQADAAAGRKPDLTELAGGRTLFLVESNHQLQEALRERFKTKGFRVLLASDPLRALDRFRQQPFDVLIVDAENAGEDGLLVFEQVMNEARDKRSPCVGIVVLGEEQAGWDSRVARRSNVKVLVRPVSWKQLRGSLYDLLGEEDKEDE